MKTGSDGVKVIIELNLDNEDDLHKYKLINASDKLLYIINDITDTLRSVAKHGSCLDCSLTEKSNICDVQDCIYKIINDRNLDLEDLCV